MIPLDANSSLTALRAAGEGTRLRILHLLAEGELTVKDLTTVLAQSQPRISRHLKLLHDARILERYREGSWVYFRLSDQTGEGQLARQILSCLDRSDPVFRRDRDQVARLIETRAQAAQEFFEVHAQDWDRVRALHVDEAIVEEAIRRILADRPIGFLVDLGTGTGRVLELLGDLYDRGLGIDTNQAMLAYARANLDKAERHNAQVRQGDLHNLALDDSCADVVVMHQVLHFMPDPAKAIVEAARLLKPAGQLLIVDFAPHDLEDLRAHFAHERLGFSDAQIAGWFTDAGLRTLASQALAPRLGYDDEMLTVSLWLAERRGNPDRRAGKNKLNEMEPVL
jgi:ubiquinone/menaquinone biosynthesis C-methylase UbiE